ncbi:FAD-dependent oxidoreductase [Halobacillus massiliensis]|uniref:FAD-dependent oxidoreductase n=1 Tax=Halobacillus massiliensis TaxID=1926286 RepID=UPI0009E19921|nr:FAD-dependent oxidoreductase [Halobacillus massiliensis]
MSFLKDKLSIFQKTELQFLKKIQEADHVYTFIFKKEADLSWKAGQHGLFTITHKKLKDSIRPFTVASSPTEGVVKITTKVSDEQPSEFKKALLELEEGMTITMSGPVGSFYIKKNSPTLLMAGGIGITPFRAMVKQLVYEWHTDNQPVEILYLDSQNTHLFKEEFDHIGREIPIVIHYLDSRNDLYQKVDQFIATHKNNAQYFISGSKSMVESISTHLKKKDVSKQNINKDTFTGIE